MGLTPYRFILSYSIHITIDAEFMSFLAHIIGCLLVALYVLGGLGLLVYMFQLVKSAFSKKWDGPHPWWMSWRP